MLGPLKSPIRLAARAIANTSSHMSALMDDMTHQEHVKYRVTNLLSNEFLRNFSLNAADSKGDFLSSTPISTLSKQHLHKTPPQREKHQEIPRLFFVQNPLTWFTVKMNFRLLRRTWDPDFDEEEFQRGTRYAISRVTQLIHDNDFANLEPLMTESGLKRLRQDNSLWDGVIRENIRLSPADIQLVIPRKINLLRVVDKKVCDVDVVCVALKWMEKPRTFESVPLLYIDLIARFRRDYSTGNDSDWMVSVFRLRKVNTLE